MCCRHSADYILQPPSRWVSWCPLKTSYENQLHTVREMYLYGYLDIHQLCKRITVEMHALLMLGFPR